MDNRSRDSSVHRFDSCNFLLCLPMFETVLDHEVNDRAPSEARHPISTGHMRTKLFLHSVPLVPHLLTSILLSQETVSSAKSTMYSLSEHRTRPSRRRVTAMCGRKDMGPVINDWIPEVPPS